MKVHLFENLISNEWTFLLFGGIIAGGIMPCIGRCIKYSKANGGRCVTIGLDAHEVNDLSADNHIANTLIKELELQEVVYEKGERIIVL